MLRWEEIKDSIQKLYEEAYRQSEQGENDYDSLVRAYDMVCKDIRHMTLAGMRVPESYLSSRSEMERRLQNNHIYGEPSWREPHRLPRDAKEFGY